MLLSTTPRLALSHITKRYPSVVANDDVSLTVLPGEIHAVLGENGAGKSTLMKIIYGSVTADAGEMYFNGKAVRIARPSEARALGIAMVFQHFSLFDSLTVAENIRLALDAAHLPKDLAAEITRLGETYGLPVAPDTPVYRLSVGERQRVEIIRALLMKPSCLILDEPTSVLTPQAVDKLFITLRQLAAEGCSIIYISHKLSEIKALCHRATVLRGGKVTGTCTPSECSVEELSRLMIGDTPASLERPTGQAHGEVMLTCHGLNLPKVDAFAVALDNINLNVHGGEIVGIAGVSGNGQAELMAALSGEDTRAAHESIHFAGQAIGQTSAEARQALGLAFVPEERLGRGAVPSHSLANNILLSHQRPPMVARGLIKQGAVQSLAKDIIARFKVKAAGPKAAASALSGGNLQKYIVGRELMRKPRCLLVSQPTWGVDVGAAAFIRQELLRLAAQGTAILVVSEELDELFELCTRMYVIADGKLSPSVATASITRSEIGIMMGGQWAMAKEVAHA